jgi:hypothetical protein
LGLKILSKRREKWDEYTGRRPKTRKPTIPKLWRIKWTAFLISLIILSELSTIQFRLTFKGHKSLEYCCLVIHLTSVSTISYAESNGGIFVLIGRIKPEIRQSPILIGLINTKVLIRWFEQWYFCPCLAHKTRDKAQQTVGPESPRLINFPAKMNKFRARARNFY